MPSCGPSTRITSYQQQVVIYSNPRCRFYSTGQRNKDGNIVKKPIAPAWLQWNGRKEVPEMTYKPGQGRIVDGKLNRWQQWGCEPLPGDVGPWKDLLDRIFGDSVAIDHRAKKISK